MKKYALMNRIHLTTSVYGITHYYVYTQISPLNHDQIIHVHIWYPLFYRYIPYGLLERTQKLNERPPYFVCRDDLETLMASRNCKDWIKIRYV